MAGGWLSSSPIIRSSQLGKPADRLPGETNSPGAGGVGGVAGCSEAGCVGIGVGKVVAKGGTAVDTGVTGGGSRAGPTGQAQHGDSRKNRHQDGQFYDRFHVMNHSLLLPWAAPKDWAGLGIRRGAWTFCAQDVRRTGEGLPKKIRPCFHSAEFINIRRHDFGYPGSKIQEIIGGRLNNSPAQGPRRVAG